MMTNHSYQNRWSINGREFQARNQIMSMLTERNRRERDGFTELFKNHQKLYENWNAVRAENLRLSVRMERSDGLSRATGNYSSKEQQEKVSILERKILSLQEELTDLHRKRSDNALSVLSLSSKLTDKEAELSKTQEQFSALAFKCDRLEEEVGNLQSKLEELENIHQLLRDEHQALHLAYTALETKHQRTMNDNMQMVQRYVEIKAKHADFMNEETENFIKQCHQKVQKDLEDAAEESHSKSSGTDVGH